MRYVNLGIFTPSLHHGSQVAVRAFFNVSRMKWVYDQTTLDRMS